MKARILALLAMVLGVVSCQTEPEGLDVNVGGDGVTTISVVLPEDAISRATAADDTDSAWSGLQNTKGETLRVILQVFDENGNTNASATLRQEQVLEEGVLTAYFDVRLVPNRKYTFVAWADQGAAYFDATDLKNVKIVEGSWTAMNEYRDAFTATHTEASFSSASNITLNLTRPFAKLRVVTTDMAQLGHLGIAPAKAAVSYNVELPNAFNAFAGTVGTTTETKSFTFDIAEYSNDAEGTKTLFTDYIFVPADGVVKFNLDTKEEDDRPIKLNQFNTDIPVKRNNLTTIAGNILTEGSNVTVTVDPVFENANNPGDAPYYQEAVTNAVDLIKALMAGKEIIVLNHITVTAVDVALATRAGEAINPVINLNGFTITIENENPEALVNLNGGTLTVEGEGAIESTAGALVEGTTVVTEGATVDAYVAVDAAGNSAVKTGLDALVYICANGGEFNFTEDLEATEVVLVNTTNPVVINGNGKTFSTPANRAIRVAASNANFTVNGLNISSSAVMIYPSDVRGISIDAELSNVQMILNNCSIDFTDKTTNDWTYAVNVSGNGTGHKVTVNGGTYEGANVVNAHGAKNTIVVKNATLNCLYANSDLYSGACIWVLQNQGSSVYAEGNTFNGSNAIAFNLGTGTTLEEKNNTDNTKYVAAKVGSTYYYNIAEAIAAAADGATVKVLQSHDCNVAATVATGKTITLDLNECTITGTDTATGSYALITNKGNLTITGNGKMTLKAENNREWNAYSSVISNTVGGKLTVESGIIEHLGGTDMAYGIDNLTNGKGTYAETVINGGTIKSTYRAVRMFLNGIEAQNLLTVNGGTIEGANKSIWMQDPSKNANTGTLVVNEGATLKGDVYLFVTAGSTSWPVVVSIAASTVKGEVLTGNVPVGYEVVLENGVWTVVAYEKIAEGLYKNGVKYLVMNAEGLATLNTMMANKTAGNNVVVKLSADIDFAGKTWTPVDSHADTKFTFAELDGQGHTISNLTINGQAMFTRFAGSGDVTIKDVTFDNATVNSNALNTSILTVQSYQNVLLDNVDVKNSNITGAYKVAPLIATVYNESPSTITATLKNCDVENTTVKATQYDYFTTGMVAFVYEDNNDHIEFENCSVKNVKLYAPNVYTLHAAIYAEGSDALYNEADGVTVENVTFENI